MNKKDLPFFAETLNKMFPNAKTELYYTNNFQLLIAVLMSAQTTDRQVNKVNRNLFEFLKVPEDWVELWIEEITMFIDSIWFYNNKAKNIYNTCRLLIKNFDSETPKTIEELVTLPWVWIKTAKVFLAVTEDAPYIWVDTHVHRILNRLWLVKTKTPLETDKVISTWFTEKNHKTLHNTLVLFWRYNCQARKPKCKECAFVKKCDYYKKIV